MQCLPILSQVVEYLIYFGRVKLHWVFGNFALVLSGTSQSSLVIERRANPKLPRQI